VQRAAATKLMFLPEHRLMAKGYLQFPFNPYPALYESKKAFEGVSGVREKLA